MADRGGTQIKAEDDAAIRQRRVLIALPALAALYVGALAWRWRDYVVDDAYIGFVFLRNLLDGQGFVFHPGGPAVEGVTNIGWILALAPAAALLGPVAAAKLIGAALLFAALILTGAVGREMGRRLEPLPHADTLMLAPPILLAASFEFLYFPLAGMETGALACALLAMARIGLRSPSSLLLPVLGAIAFTLHPEAVLVYPLFLALRLFARLPLSSLSRFVRAGVLYLTLLALITLGRWWAFGAVLPNTFASKPPAEIAAIASGLVELLSGGHLGIGFPIAGLLGLALAALGGARLRRAAPEAAAMLAAIAGTGLLFALYARPDWTFSARYFAPYLPAALLLLWIGALDLANRLWPARIAPLAVFGALLLAVLGLSFGARLGAMERYPGYVMAGRTLTGPSEEIARIVPEGDTIATRRIGALAYVSGREVFDYVYGLTEPEVAELVARRGKAFEQPSNPALEAVWKARAPGWILEDEAVLAEIARKAGGTLDRFALHGIAYGAVRKFPIAPDVEWVLARRKD